MTEPSRRMPFPKVLTAITLLLCAAATYTVSQTFAQQAEDQGEAQAEGKSAYDNAGVRIRDIQGAGHISPMDGESVSGVIGVVTYVAPDKLFLQDEFPDDDPATSEALVVYFGRDAAKDAPSVGARVKVSGVVVEWDVSGMKLTEITSRGSEKVKFEVLKKKVDLPEPVRIGKQGRMPPTVVIDDDGMKTFDAVNDGLDFWESLEAMRIELVDAVVVGATKHGGFVALGDKGEGCSERTTRGGIVIDGETGDFNPERVVVSNDFYGTLPDVTVGDSFEKVTGVVYYEWGSYQLYATDVSEPVSAELAREKTELASDDQHLTVASFNIENFSRADGDRAEELADAIITHLKSPDVIGVQEILDNDGTTRSMVVDGRASGAELIRAIRKAGGPNYAYLEIAPTLNEEGGIPGGNIRVGYLYNTERIEFEASKDQADAKTKNAVSKSGGRAKLKYNPGRIDPENEAWESTRRPLAAQFTHKASKQSFIVINCHLSSKRGDEGLFGPNQPPVLHSEEARIKQAKVVGEFAEEIVKKDSEMHVFVLGDMNDYDFSKSMSTLAGSKLENLLHRLELPERYTYIYQGNSQVLDQIFLGGPLKGDEKRVEIDVVHINSEYPSEHRVSDHDPVLARVKLVEDAQQDDE